MSKIIATALLAVLLSAALISAIEVKEYSTKDCTGDVAATFVVSIGECKVNPNNKDKASKYASCVQGGDVKFTNYAVGDSTCEGAGQELVLKQAACAVDDSAGKSYKWDCNAGAGQVAVSAVVVVFAIVAALL
jgi:hypothetical protein